MTPTCQHRSLSQFGLFRSFRESIRGKIGLLVAGSLLIGVAAPDRARADEPKRPPILVLKDYVPKPLAPSLPTAGGIQFWSDEFAHGKWHIQRNVVTGHYRLLDQDDVRRAWGTYEDCLAEFAACQKKIPIEPMRPDVVIVLHGIGGFRGFMSTLCEGIEETGNYSCINVAYASTRGTLADHAQSLGKLIDHLAGVERVHFVAHSMGNLVIREYFTELATKRKPEEVQAPKLGRFVMLGPPNQGAELAQRLHKVATVSTLLGPTVKELAEAYRLERQFAAPPCEFGIIAASQGNNLAFNPLITGDDDLVVAVEETRLLGAADFLTISGSHRSLVTDPVVRQCVIRFLTDGYFVSPDQRHPIR